MDTLFVILTKNQIKVIIYGVHYLNTFPRIQNPQNDLISISFCKMSSIIKEQKAT